MTGIATAIGVGVAGVAAGVYSANKAAGAQESAANTAANTQLGMYQQTRADLAPYNIAGQSATQALRAFYGLPGGKGPSAANLSKTLTSLPGYQFMLSQGTQAIDRSEAAQGLLNSGATGKALTQYGQGLAQSQALTPYLSGLQGLAAQGESAAAQTGYAGTSAASGAAQAQLAGGTAAASGYAGQYNALSGGINQGIGLYGLAQGYGGFGGYGGPGATNALYGANGPLIQGGAGYVYNNPYTG